MPNLKFDVKIEEKDNGLTDIEKIFGDLKTGATLTVGITENSPRGQFRFGESQEFRPETAGLLLRKPVDAKNAEIKAKLTDIGRRSFKEGKSPKEDLKKLGEEIKADMSAQTDPPPQLRNAIIVEVEDGVE